MNEIKRVIIVDDHPIALRGFSVIVETVPTLKVVAEAHNAQEAVSKVLAMNPDIAIIDIEMSRDAKDGFDIACEIVEMIGIQNAAIGVAIENDEIEFRQLFDEEFILRKFDEREFAFKRVVRLRFFNRAQNGEMNEVDRRVGF